MGFGNEWRLDSFAMSVPQEPVLKVGGTGYQPVFGGNLPPEQATGLFHPKPSFITRSQPEGLNQEKPSCHQTQSSTCDL